MGLFHKELSDYKVMEKYKKNLDDFYVFGETEKYRLYLDKRLNQYIMRQDKQNPKQVVKLGWLRGEKCVFHDRIFFINKWSYTGRSENPLNYIDVETGNSGTMSVLSNKGCWLAMHWHCQDTVNSLDIKDDKIVIDVTRYKENAHDEKALSYLVYISYEKGKFKVHQELSHKQALELTQEIYGERILSRFILKSGERIDELFASFEKEPRIIDYFNYLWFLLFIAQKILEQKYSATFVQPIINSTINSIIDRSNIIEQPQKGEAKEAFIKCYWDLFDDNTIDIYSEAGMHELVNLFQSDIEMGKDFLGHLSIFTDFSGFIIHHTKDILNDEIIIK